MHWTKGRCTAIVFNQMDNSGSCSRISSLGQYNVHNGLPLNPVGRTGMQGRGALGRWGPNYASDPVVTRWRMVEGHRETRHGKPVLEFVAVMRSDNQMWALPGAGGSVELAMWQTASSDLMMRGAHSYFLSLVAEKLGEGF